jgi:hypothetical protein
VDRRKHPESSGARAVAVIPAQQELAFTVHLPS